MVTEQVTYGIKTTGHSTPEPERKLVKPSSELKKAFEQWRDQSDGFLKDRDIYLCAQNAVLKVKDPTIDEAHALLFEYEPHFLRDIGLFFSAVYNRSREKIICLDVVVPKEVRLNGVGYSLPADKIFVNKTNVSGNIGQFAAGLIINYSHIKGSCHGSKIINYDKIEFQAGEGSNIVVNMGECGDFSAQHTHAIAINFGTAEEYFGDQLDENGTLINVGKAQKNFGSYCRGRIICLTPPDQYPYVKTWKQLIRHEDCAQMPELVKYFADMKTRFEAGREDIEKAIQAMQSLDKARIDQDLERIVVEAGFAWTK